MTNTCHFPNCDRKRRTRDLCHTHAEQKRRYGTVHQIGERVARKKRLCSVDGCTNEHRAVGLCSTHYNARNRPAPVTREAKARPLKPPTNTAVKLRDVGDTRPLTEDEKALTRRLLARRGLLDASDVDLAEMLGVAA